jgi:hypothetical protein
MNDVLFHSNCWLNAFKLWAIDLLVEELMSNSSHCGSICADGKRFAYLLGMQGCFMLSNPRFSYIGLPVFFEGKMA